MDKRVEKFNALIKRIAKGDSTALDVIYDEFGGILLMIAKKYLTDKSLAEDVLSEALYKLVKNSKKFDSKKNGLNWIFKIIHNQAIDVNKKQNPFYYAENIEDHPEISAAIFSNENIISRMDLRYALHKLNEDESKIIYYKYWEQLTVREIAEKVHKPRSTVQHIIKQSMQKIEKELKD